MNETANSVAAAAIFDLDGVLVDTAPLHFAGWSRVAQSLGHTLDPDLEPRLRGVARTESLRLVLASIGVTVGPEREAELLKEKNDWFVDQVGRLDASALLTGALDALQRLAAAGVPRALASASHNAPLVLERTGVARLFDVVVDARLITHPKPDPEIFLTAAEELGQPPARCIVFEDAPAGVAAANAAGCRAVGIGSPAVLPAAEAAYPNLAEVPLSYYFGIPAPTTAQE